MVKTSYFFNQFSDLVELTNCIRQYYLVIIYLYRPQTIAGHDINAQFQRDFYWVGFKKPNSKKTTGFYWA